MCEPVSISIGVAALLAAGTAYYSSQQQAKAQEYQAAVQSNNAIIADRQASDRVAQGEKEELQHRLRVAQLMGEQRAQFAANGVVLDQADTSPLAILEDTAAFGEYDAQVIRENARREAEALRYEAAGYRVDSAFSQQQAGATRVGGYLSAGASLLSGAGRVSSAYSANTASPTPTGLGQSINGNPSRSRGRNVQSYAGAY